MIHYQISTRSDCIDCYFRSHKDAARLFEKLGYIIIMKIEILE